MWDTGLAYSIKVVRQILILFVEVRILVGQQDKPLKSNTNKAFSGFFIFVTDGYEEPLNNESGGKCKKNILTTAVDITS